MDWTTLSISEAAGFIKNGELSPVLLTRAHLDWIGKLDSQYNTYITVTGELAMEAAQQAEDEIKRGNYRGALHGIPVALKDLYDTASIRTSSGTQYDRDRVPEENAFVVDKLIAGGAVILGKQNMHEIALGVTNENPHYSAARNPWDLTRITGGSSGGSGAAVAAGLCMGALGSDTGGSIRIPASLCGIVGFKPTYGLISKRGVVPLSWNLDHAGPMARNVMDAAILLEAISGYDPLDPYAIDKPELGNLSNIRDSIKGWKIAVAVGEFFKKADDDVLEVFSEAVDTFATLGAEITRVGIPWARDTARANGLMTTSDAAAYHKDRMDASPEDYGADVLERLQAGAAFTSSEYILARRTQTLSKYKFAQLFKEFDILLTPSTPITAPELSSESTVSRAPQLTRFTSIFNLTGLPAISIPCGFNENNLPIGLQIAGPAWGDARVLQAAYAFENGTPWHLFSPPALYPGE